MDGDIDYSSYGLRELLQIKKYINKAEYPANYANLIAAIEAHPDSQNLATQGGSAEAGVWAPMGDKQAYGSLGAKDTTILLAIFFIVFYPVTFLFEYAFIVAGWSVGTIVRVIYFAISAAVVGAVFGVSKKRLMTANEFSGFAAATAGMHLLLMIILTFLITAGTDGELGWACGPACGIFTLAVLVSLDLAALYICLRFVMRWTMVASAGKPK